MNFETENIEFKSQFTEEIYKEVIAFLKGKGLKPSGVFVRQGTSSVPVSPDQIRQMIKDSDGDAFEENRSLDQDLTFESAQKAFQMYGVNSRQKNTVHSALFKRRITFTPILPLSFRTSALIQQKLRCSAMMPVRYFVTAESLGVPCLSNLRTR